VHANSRRNVRSIELYTTSVDLTKAFDTVSRDGLWKIMKKYGCPDKFITIVRQFHDGMTSLTMVTHQMLSLSLME